MQINLTDVVIAAIAAGVLSLALSYLPKAGPWYNAQASEAKVQINGGLMLLVTLALFGLGCANLLSLNVTCDKAGAMTLASMLISALVTNQGIYNMFVKPFPQNNPPMPMNVKGAQPK